VIRDLAERGAPRQRRAGIGRAAVMIAVITVLARLVGFGRQVVFAHTVGTTCLGTAYTTANMVPNIIYDIVLGGALSSVVVPVLAGPAARARAAGGPGTADETSRQIAAALLTWTVLLLVPVSAVLALTAHPVVTALLSGSGGCARGPLTAVGARMLVVFAPQVLLYGLAVVLYGILQSHRRFGAPALAPLLSSFVVIGTYTAFGSVGGAYVDRLARLPAAAEYLLSGGTTLGVLALVATAVVPAWRLGLGSRPTLRFPAGIGVRVRRLALAGVATVVAQDASVAAVIVLANHYGAGGSLVIYGFAWAVFVVPYAVLAVPIATSAFPELSAHGGTAGTAGADGARAGGDSGAGADGDSGFDLTAAASTRAVTAVSWLGAAVLLGAREPIARVFESRSAPAAAVLALALVAFAPGLVGYGLSANLSRVLYARRRSRAPALAVAGGWLLVIAADATVVPFVPAARVVPVLGLGTTFGLTVSGIALLVLVRRDRGPAALRGVARTLLAGAAGCAAGALAGWSLARAVAAAAPALARGAFVLNAGLSVLVAGVVTVVFAVVVASLDGGDLRAALSRMRSRSPA
jgi:peptidoglycan biosynthesis protein MviN/MurJ (putative lipid II flippase)